MDSIRLKGMRFVAKVGVTEAERANPQTIEVDVEIEADLQRAGRSDELKATIDYARVYARIARALEGREARLLEALAERAAQSLAEFKPILVTVTVRKRAPPIPGGSAEVAEVTVSRRPVAFDEE